MKKLALFVATVAVVGAASAVPGLAKPPADGDHKVTICHVTGSERNPWVVITIDRSAWDGEGANDHTHHEKNGRSDHVLPASGICREVGGIGDPGDNGDDGDVGG